MTKFQQILAVLGKISKKLNKLKLKVKNRVIKYYDTRNLKNLCLNRIIIL